MTSGIAGSRNLVVLTASPALINGYSDEGNYCNSSVLYTNRKSTVMSDSQTVESLISKVPFNHFPPLGVRLLFCGFLKYPFEM